MKVIMYVLLLIVVLLGVTFAILNSAAVTVNYYLGVKTLPLSLLIVFVFAAGCLAGLFIGFLLLVKTKLKNYRLKQRLNMAEKEVQNLRAIPLQDKH